MYSKEKLAAILRENSLKIAPEGEFFTLASGKKSKYYCDGRMTTLDSHGATLIGEGILDLILAKGELPNAVGGMTLGADPICAAIITVAGMRGLDLKGFIVRKETKDHGTKKYVEGPVKAGDRVIVVEDVVTTGGSSLKAIERLDSRPYGRGRPSVYRSRLLVPVPFHNRRLRNRTAASVILKRQLSTL